MATAASRDGGHERLCHPGWRWSDCSRWSMGGQNATARRLAVPDLTTTVLTLTVTGLVADTTSLSVRARRLVAILSMLIGALAGGLLIQLDLSHRAALAGRRAAARLRCHGSHCRQPRRCPDVAIDPPPSQLVTRSVS